MARIKAEVKEHAQQQRLARQHQHHHSDSRPHLQQHHDHPSSSPPPAVVPAPATLSLTPVEPTAVVVKVEATSRPVDVVGTGCIDLTADEETEDEEDADEPFAAPASSQVEEAQHDERREQAAHDVVPAPELLSAVDADPDVDVEVDAYREEHDEGRKDHSVRPNDASVASVALAAAGDDDETDESEEDEEMPLVRPGSEQPSSPPHDMTGGVCAAVNKIGHALNAVTPALGLSGGATSEGQVDSEVEEQEGVPPQGDSVDTSRVDDDVSGNDNEEEEEDEQWPELRPRALSEEAKQQHESEADEDMVSTASEGDEGSIESSTPVDVGVVKTGKSLEDGEIFEEGAVVKSPTAVKEAIALELQARAAATTKKKQKKRGRKKNKRKVDVMLASSPAEQEEIDEFGRSVRHQSTAPSMSMTQVSHVHEFLPSMTMNSTPSPPIPAGARGPPLLPLPLLMATPPIPQPHHLPPHEFGNPHAPRQFVDDQIVRVNRHGGFEPFAFHGNRAPRPSIAPPFLPPARPPPAFRYVSVDYFSPERNDAADSPNRGLKRPLPANVDTQRLPVTDTADVVFDLDSLRAAALKTKRKTPAKESNVAVVVPTDSRDLGASATNRAADTPATAAVAQAEEDPSIDALRMQLLKSVRRKRREGSSQSTADATDSPGDGSSSQKGSEASGEDAQVSSQEAPVVPKLTPLEPLVPESPQFRPLTAMSQSIVIRLSLDDLSSEQTKARADSYDAAAKRFDKVLDDIRAQAAASKPSVSLGSSNIATSAQKAKATMTPAVQVSSPEKPMIVAIKQMAQSAMTGSTAASVSDGSETKATEAAIVTQLQPLAEPARAPQDTTDVGKQQVVLAAGAIVDVDILADPAKLEAERKACLANIREADAHISRLDADIAALRLVIATREAETSSASSSATACGA